MATVTTPAGDVLEGVTGQLLDYYRGEGYDIVDDEPEVEDAPVVEQVEATEVQDAEPQYVEVPVLDDDPPGRDHR